MHARVAKFEGAQADAMRRSAEQANSQASSGPPEGVPSTGFLMLIDPDNGRGLGVSLYESEEDMRTGHEVLNKMSPPDDGMGRRTSVEMYEVAVDVRI